MIGFPVKESHGRLVANITRNFPPGDKPPHSLAIREAISEILVGAQFVVRFSGEVGFSSLVESLLHIGRGFDCFIVAGIDPVQKDVSI